MVFPGDAWRDTTMQEYDFRVGDNCIMLIKLGEAHPNKNEALANVKSAYADAGFAEGFDAWLQKACQ